MTAAAIRLGVGVDSATTRLIAAARATQATEGLPKDSARQLVALARGVRLYLDAGQARLAMRSLDDLQTLMSSGVEDAVLVEAYAALAKSVRTAVGWKPKATAA